MKKWIALLLALLMVMGTVGCLAGGASDCEAGKHSMGPWQTYYKATCTQPGERYRVCQYCRYSETEEIPPAGHYYPDPWVTIQAPTCTEPGRESNTCKRVMGTMDSGAVSYCGNVWIREIPALGHDWGEWYIAKEPTVEEDGYEQRDCQRCGIHETRPLTLDGDEDEIGDMEVDLYKEVLNSPMNGSFFTENEIVSYRVTVFNCQNEAYYDLEVIDPLKGEDEDSVLTVEPVFAPHAVLELGFDYTVTAEDAERGYIENTAIAYWREEGGEEPRDMCSNTVTVPTGREEPDGCVSLTKTVTSVPQNGIYYTPGEEVTYKIVFHKQGPSLRLVVVYDPICMDDEKHRVTYDSSAAEGDYWLGNSFSYTVTEDDALMGCIVNQAYATWESPEINGTNTVFSNIVTVPVGFEGDLPVPVSDLTITKMFTTVPANGQFYTEGEVIGYRVVVKNEGDGPACGVVIDDYIWTSSMEIGDIAPEDTFYGDYSHIVTKDDVDMGGVLNRAWVEYENVTGDYRYAESENLFAPCGTDSPEDTLVYLSKYLKSAPANGMFFVEGETVVFTLDWGNIGSETAYDVEIHDNDFLYYVGTLAPGEVGDVEYEYIVTGEDALKGFFGNQAFALWGTAPGAQERVTFSEYLTINTGIETPQESGKVTVNKVRLNEPADGIAFTENETIYYLVTVTNNQNESVYGVEVYDALWTLSNSVTVCLTTETELAPGESIAETYAYTVTAQDCLDGLIYNECDVYFYHPDGSCLEDWACSGIVTAPTHPGILPPQTIDDFGVYKYVANLPAKGYFEKDDKIEFIVVAYNNSGVVYTDVEGYDILLDTPGYFFGSMAVLDDTPALMHIFYTVTDIDALLGSVSNVAWVTAKDPDGNVHMVTSNEVVVPIGQGTSFVPMGGKESCDIYTTGRGAGFMAVKTDYCSEHGRLDEKIGKLLEQADSEEQKTAALSNAVQMWQQALDREYNRLLAEADEELARLIMADRATANAEYEARITLVKELGVVDDAGLYALEVRLLRARTCELCAARAAYHQGLTDHGEPDAATGRPGAKCVVSVEEGNGRNVTVTELCRIHAITDKAVLRLEEVPDDIDAETAAALQAKISACREKDKADVFARIMKTADADSIAGVMMEKNASERYDIAHSRLISKLYADYPEAAAEISQRAKVELIAFLCSVS